MCKANGRNTKMTSMSLFSSVPIFNFDYANVDGEVS